MPALDRNAYNLFQTYLESWFCQKRHLARMCAVTPDAIDRMVEADCIPGAVYYTAPDGYAWSALAAYLGQNQHSPMPDWTAWYSPAAAYWIRLARLLANEAPEQTAGSLKAHFAHDYAGALENLPSGLQDYASVADTPEDAWQAWTSGAYAVCMRNFSGKDVAEKLTRRARAMALLDRASLNETETLTLLEDVSRLSAILTPFSPFERPNGTPGTVIDAALTRLGLGDESPFLGVEAAPILKAC